MPVKSKLWLTFLAGMFATHVVIRADALPVSISFLDSDEALQQTTSFLASKGIDTNSVDWFRRAVKWHNKTPLGFDLGGFPKSSDGFYTFQSMSNLTDSLPQPLIYAKHESDMNCFDNVILLVGSSIQTKLQPDALAGPFLVEIKVPTTSFVVNMAVEETARDSFNAIYPPSARERTKLVFGGPREDGHMCLTAAFDSYCMLPHKTTGNDLGISLLKVLQAQWKQEGIIFPSNMEVVICESAVIVPPDVASNTPFYAPFGSATHAGLMFKNHGGFVYIEKAGFDGPYVRLDFKDKTDLLLWLKTLVKPTTAERDHLFAIFNGSQVYSLDEIKP